MTTPPASPGKLCAVLFDSGGVLMRPIGGRWNPRADFEETVLAHAPSITPEQFAAAVSAGDDFFATSSSTADYDDYHRVMLRHLGVEPTSQLLADLCREVPPSVFLETYPDPRMYHHASTALGLAPSQCLFVDDDPDLVAAAVRLGYAGRALCRDGAVSEVPSIRSLTELLHCF